MLIVFSFTVSTSDLVSDCLIVNPSITSCAVLWFGTWFVCTCLYMIVFLCVLIVVLTIRV